ncbi:hypothetical protein ACFQS1_10580 [Paractinoplanes rhizophilus]|uniref:Uncharacterized protein n=1 Tax=Paractinoplanes rhizophilus TaxID=1416877 RepID=A0ABW2HPK0_9ACTN
MRLSELLDEVRADAPPPRYDVADVVRAGKRLRRRRRAGWVLAAGTAVAVVIAAPFLVSAPQRTIQQAGPLPSPSATSKPTPEVNYLLSAYTTGKLQVGDPMRWTLAGETAPVDKEDGAGDAPEGEITLYHRGVDPRSTLDGAKITPTAPVRGRPAYQVDADGSPMFLWEYADDAMALVASRANGPGKSALTPKELRQVADAFKLGTPEPVRIGFGADYVPEGYQLVEITSASALFIPTADAVARRGKPDSPASRPLATISLRISPAGAQHGRPRDGVLCPEDTKGGNTGLNTYCYAFLGTLRVEEARSRNAVDTVELGRMIKSGKYVPPSDPASWMPVTQAFPASALIGAE